MIPIGSVDMPVTPPHGTPQSLLPLTRSADPRSPEAVGVKFESMFLSQILKEMRETLEPDGLFGEDHGDVYGGLFDLFLGQHLAQAGGLGLARIVKHHLETTKKDEHPSKPPTGPTSR
jgi:Rod binding domain-containing protein